MPQLITCKSTDLDWKLDFRPLRNGPSFLPILAVAGEEKPIALSGFNLKNSKLEMTVLQVEGDSLVALESLYPKDTLRPLESMRYLRVTSPGNATVETYSFLFGLTPSLQDFFDQKVVPLKALKPLSLLGDWLEQIESSLFKLNPSSSQIREILDLLVDLKLSEAPWPEALGEFQSCEKALGFLTQLRHPKTKGHDQKNAEEIQRLPWPRGINAKWERRGDHAGIKIETVLSSYKDWIVFRNNLNNMKLEDGLEDGLWNP